MNMSESVQQVYLFCFCFSLLRYFKRRRKKMCYVHCFEITYEQDCLDDEMRWFGDDMCYEEKKKKSNKYERYVESIKLLMAIFPCRETSLCSFAVCIVREINTTRCYG